MGTARELHLQVPLYLRKSISYNTAGAAAGVEVGRVPAGSLISNVYVVPTTAFNGSGTVTMTAGSTGTGTDVLLAADANIKTTTTKVGTTKKYFAAESTIYAAIVDQNTDSTAGTAIIIVEFVQNNDQ